MLNCTLLLLSTFAITLSQPAFSQSYLWRDIGGDLAVSTVNSSSGGESFGVAGFSIDQVGLQLELHSANDIIQKEYPNLSQDYFTVNEKGERISVRPTVSEVWKIVSRRSDVVGLVPVGYSETAGSSEIAGFYRIGGQSYNSVFSAPNMDTIVCLNDLEREGHDDQNFDVPFLFEANVGPRYSYTYQDGVDPVEFDHLDTPNRWRDTFRACNDMIQVGFRLVDPRHIMRHHGRSTRLVKRLPVDLSVKTFALTAMMFDRNARFSFVRFGDISPVTAGKILSSNEFQEKTCSRSVSGASNCEIWATMLTAFDDAAMFVRSSPDADLVVYGNPDVISPAVLVLARRNDETAETSISHDELTSPPVEE